MKKIIAIFSLSILSFSLSASAGNLKTEKICLDNTKICSEHPAEFKAENCADIDMLPIGFDPNGVEMVRGFCSEKDMLNNFVLAKSKQKSGLKEQLSAIEKNQARKVSYKKLAKQYLLASGYENENIFYQATKEIKTGEYVTISFVYPKKDKKKYDSYLDKVVKDFIKGLK